MHMKFHKEIQQLALGIILFSILYLCVNLNWLHEPQTAEVDLYHHLVDNSVHYSLENISAILKPLDIPLVP